MLYFEKAFEAILPPSCRGHYSMKSNRVDNVTLRELKPVECFGLIQACDILGTVFLGCSGVGARAPIRIPPTSGGTCVGGKDSEEEMRRQNIVTDRMKEVII